jgi:alpha-tubulin suppressor-like RCC1 family protein
VASPALASKGRIHAIATGHEHTCVVLEAGTVWCWGNNSKGQLGNTSAAAQEKRPVRAGAFENAQAIAAGFEHTCVVRLGGSVECWGSNAHGQVGKSPASNEPVLTPHQVPSVYPARNVVAGANHTCAILLDDTVRCWGNGTKGQLGDGFNADRPIAVKPSLSNVSILGAGSSHTCVLTNGSVQCWGYNGFGQLGIGGESSFQDRVVPTLVKKLGAAAAHIATGTGHTCVALVNGNGQCFGRDSYWQLGNDAEYSNKEEPVNVLDLIDAVQVAAGRDHSCATLSNGAARCWGRNFHGQLGNNGSDDSFEPVNVVGL